ncbi:MAG: aldo/keto reductase [Armatimonadota bacterium]
MGLAELGTRVLGRTGLRVTPLGLGGAHLGRVSGDRFDQAQAVAAVHRALELGINLIDTSPMYGPSEQFLGVALAEWFAAGGRREELVISTKTGFVERGVMDYSGEWTRRSIERSLRRLGLDYLDVALVHDPRDLAPVFAPGAALEALEGLKQQGLVRAIGLGVRNQAFHRTCIASGRFDVSLSHCDYNLLDFSAADAILPHAAEHEVGVLNGAAVMLGLLCGEDPRTVAPTLGGFATEQRLQRAVALWEWATTRGLTLLAVNLQFCLREPRIASTLVGVRDVAEIEADVAAVSAPLPHGVWSDLGRVLSALDEA